MKPNKPGAFKEEYFFSHPMPVQELIADMEESGNGGVVPAKACRLKILIKSSERQYGNQFKRMTLWWPAGVV